MAINLDNVKAITHNNKDVIKIEDSNGNIIWTKPSTDKYLYYVAQSNSYALNTRTLELTKFDVGNANTYGGPGTPWSDGTNVYFSSGSYSDSRSQRKINFNGDTVSSSANTWTGVTGRMYGNETFTDGTNVYWSSSSITSVYKLTPGTTTWTSATLSGSVSTYDSANVFRFAGNTYCIKDSEHIVRLNGTTWTTVRNNQGQASEMKGYYFWTPDEIHLFYTDGSYNYKINTTDFSREYSYWTGPTPGSNSLDRMFKIGEDVYLAYGSVGSYTIYKLDLTTLDNSTLVWTDVTSQFTIPSEGIMTLFIDEGGIASPRCGYGIKAAYLN